jgi:molybdopterin synthase catalytic subunit
MQVRLATARFDPQQETAAFAAGRADMGALVSFIGLCREANDGRNVQELFIDHYAGFTEREIARIAAEVAGRFDCPDLLVVHRVGVIAPGEAIVLVAALSEHRGNGFEAVRVLMDYLKIDAPLWKKESGPDGVRWIEPRAEDRAWRTKAEEERI